MASIKKLLFGTRIRICLTILVLLVGIYALAGFVLVPWLARPRIVETVAELTGRETRLDELKLNPFTLAGTLKGFEITDTDGAPLLSFDRAYANVQALSFLFGGEYHFKQMDLDVPFFRLQVSATGTLNVADLINQITNMAPEEPELQKEPTAVKVDVLTVNEGSISITDLSLSAPFTSTIEPINFDITGFHTSGESNAPYAFSATSESGEAFSWEGYVALEPLRSKGSFEVNGFSMPKYEPFYDIVLLTDVVDGSISVKGSYEYNSGIKGAMKLLDAAVTIENVEVVKGSDQSPVMSLELGSISGVNMDYFTRNLEVQSILFKNGSMHAKRLEDGTIDLLDLIDQSAIAPSTTDEEPEPASETGPTPGYHIQSISLEGFSIHVLDEAAPTPASFALDQANLTAKNIRSEAGVPIDLNLSADIRSGGKISANGSAILQPVSADISLELSECALTPGNPYLTEFADIQLTDGKLSISGNSTISLESEKPTGGFTGNLQLADLKFVESDLGQDLVGLSKLDLADIAVVLDPMSVEVGAITLTDPGARVLVNEDSSINLLKALRIAQEEEAIEEEVAQAEETEKAEVEIADEPTGLVLPFPVTIGSITLENAGAVLTDRSISPSVNLGLETLSGTISGLSSEELARADLDLVGTLVGGTQLAVSGKINPLIEDRYSDVEMSFKNFNLTAVSPYSGKYAGYALSKGHLSFDLKYKVSQSELSGENVMVIDQLTLGEKVESEDALKLPIPLAVSLMKDKDGVIEIDVPVSGNLNDPEFSFGRVISRAIVNVLTKLITSPFSMLGNLIPGGKDVDLSLVTFVPGVSEFDEEALKKLDLLAEALKERPNLTLEIVGAAGGPAEITDMKLRRLDKNLQTLRWRELKNAGNDAVTLDEVVLTAGDRERLIGISFNLMFPDDGADTIPGEPSDRLAEPAPTEEPSQEVDETEKTDDQGLGGFFRRLFGGSDESATDEPVPQTEHPTPSPEPQIQEAEIAAKPEPRPRLTNQQMESRLLETLEVNEDDLHQLADSRAEAVRAHLETLGEIAANRLFVVEPEDPATVDAESGQPQVFFELQ